MLHWLHARLAGTHALSTEQETAAYLHGSEFRNKYVSKPLYKINQFGHILVQQNMYNT